MTEEELRYWEQYCVRNQMAMIPINLLPIIKLITAYREQMEAIKKLKYKLSYFIDQTPSWPEDKADAYEVRQAFFNWLQEGKRIAISNLPQTTEGKNEG